jgi:hypothetical protein
MDKIPFMKIDDLVITDEETWGELIACYIEVHPDAQGHISFEDEDIMEKATLLTSRCCVGNC